ncbi:glycosyltransferase [Halorubrum halodurans]|uniref:Glycosyltransferase subfamily 4-like N-terminal domain-containing protein n=1 Tax=Halorubrum halodurans TaxID=1383851 RepID=A0A256IH47_9EURY|nr:glycosyltransferase [Halorubrum halodurans]OYR55803.1 hypothetical protein DJ70_10800 [Halorubrum halodurans]
MKILHVCGTFPPAYAYGGPPRSVENLTSALADAGHDVTVYTTDAMNAQDRAQDYNNPELLNGVKVFRFRNVSNSLAWKNIQIPPRMLFSLFTNTGKFDVVHTHEFRSPPTVFSHLAAEFRDVPHVHQPRGSVPRFGLSGLKKMFDSIIGKRMLSSVDRIIASSNTESSNFSDVLPSVDFKKVRHIPNGISVEKFRERPECGAFREKYEINENERLVLFLSRLHPRKGGDMLINAVSELSDESIRLVFVGPNEGAQGQWKAIAGDRGIAERTLFTGPLYGSDKLSAYADADVFVLPSKNEYESFGNVVLEALACGTPAICTNVCGVAEWIDHDGCSVVLPEPSSLSKELRCVFSSTSNPSSLRKYIGDEFSWRSVASMTERVYREIATTRRW